MNESTGAQQIARFAVQTLGEGAPPEVRRSAQQRVLDIVGLQLASLELETSRGVLAMIAEQGGAPQARIVGGGAAPAAAAALGNGVLAHSLDYDDTHLPSVLHPSASVVPAALAAAELAGADGAALLDAVAVGIETVVRLGMVGYDHVTNSSIYFEHGQHATSICGAVGSAVAAALLLDGREESVAHAIGVAASMASGVIEANRTGGNVKRLHCGWAAHAGVSAAQLVGHGFTGPPTALEGRFGLFRAFLHGDGRPEELTRGLGEHWEVPGILFKPYPANHFTHTGLDAARRLRERGLRAEEVESAQLCVASSTVRTIGEPLEVKQRPETGYQAQFSGPYMVALGLLGGSGLGAGFDDFSDELATDPARRELMARVTVQGDSTCDEIFPNQLPSILRVRTRDGRDLEERVLVNRGSPQDPLSDEELAMKFRDNAARRVDAKRAQAIVDACAELAERPITELVSLLP